MKRLRTREDDPWLSRREIGRVNFFNTKAGQERFAAVRDYFTIAPLIDADLEVRWAEPLLKHRHLHPDIAMECDRGGWLPNGVPFAGSQTAADLAYRQFLKSKGEIGEADLVRRVVTGGDVEVRDFHDGTMWIFAHG
jgi:hypothetical protein